LQSQTFRELSAQKLRILKVIWAGLTGSILVYSAVIYAIPGIGSASLGGGQSLSIVFVALAVGSGSASVFLRALLLSENRVRKQLEQPIDAQQLSTDKQTGQLNEAKLRKIESLGEFEQKLLLLLNWYFVPNIICWGLNESIAVFGLVLVLLEGNPSSVIPFAGAALLLNFSMFPKFDVLVDKARSLHR
jgi:hypothetical protein